MTAFGLDLDYLALGVLFCVGLYMLVAKSHLLKKLLGLNVMSTSVFGFIVTSGMIEGGSAPILGPLAERYFTTAMISSGNDPTTFITRPISAVLVVAWVVVLGFLVYRSVKSSRPMSTTAPPEGAESTKR